VALSNDLKSNLTIDWESFTGFSNDTEKSVKITPEPEFAMLVVLNQIYQFNDQDDRGVFNLSTFGNKDIASFDTSLFTYQFNKTVQKDHFVEFKVHATKYNDSNIGIIEYNIQTYGDYDHGWNFPHLLHNSNGTQLDIVFDKFKVKKNYRGPRLAIEMVYMTSEPKSGNTSFIWSRRRTLDDEHTPGIFELDNLQSPSSYFEYRPVSYTHPWRDVTTSTDTHLSPLITPNSTFNENSLAFAYFGYLKDHLVQAANISFGQVNDGFYTKTNYTSFTFLIGLGLPPTEELSKFVVTVALVGVGVPIIMLVVGITCICLKRVRTYRRLMEEAQ